MNITLVAAFRSEAAGLLGLLDSATKEKKDGVRFWRGLIGVHRITVLICGLGPERAAESLARAADLLAGTELTINFGVCGALNSESAPGEVVIMESVAAVWKADCEPLKLHDLVPAMPGVRGGGRLVTHCRPVFDTSVASRLAIRFGAGYVDMESWEIANYFRHKSIPAAVVKAVSDRAGGEAVEDFALHARQAAACCARVVHGVLREI